MRSEKRNTTLLIVMALIFASMISVAMVIVRAFYVGRLVYTFLVWNLFLAWLPLIFAWASYKLQGNRIALLLFGSLWLLFAPNSLYLVTDLIHLQYSSGAPLWFDALLIFTFALTGWLIGLLSLYLMQMLVSQRGGRIIGWLFAAIALGLSSYGVYVGRFLRWNSWDIFAHPLTLLNDMVGSLIHPHLAMRTYTVSLLFSAIFMFSYVILFSLPRIALEHQSE